MTSKRAWALYGIGFFAAIACYMMSFVGARLVIVPPGLPSEITGYLRQIGYGVIEVALVQWMFLGIFLGTLVFVVKGLLDILWDTPSPLFHNNPQEERLE